MGMSLGTFGKILDEFFLVLNKLGNVSSFSIIWENLCKNKVISFLQFERTFWERRLSLGISI